MRVLCPQSVLLRASADARDRFPAECCGVLTGVWEEPGCRLVGYLPVQNRSAEPGAFRVGAVDFARLEAGARRRGLDLCGFLHSHPDGSPIPSASDRLYAWPGYLQIILPVCRGTPGEPLVWFPRGGDLRPIPRGRP